MWLNRALFVVVKEVSLSAFWLLRFPEPRVTRATSSRRMRICTFELSIRTACRNGLTFTGLLFG